MITYVDTSTLIKLLVAEPGSDRAGRIWDSADNLASVTLVVVESRGALASAERGGRITRSQHRRAKSALGGLVEQIDLVEVTLDIVMAASDIAEREGLRGYDAVHLAAAVFVGADVMSTADRDLAAAAQRLSMAIADPTSSD